MDFKNGKELLALCKENNMSIAEVMIKRESEATNENSTDIKKRMGVALDIMKNAAKSSIQNPVKSIGGLIGGEAKKVSESEYKICGDILSDAISYSLSVLEVNATMGLIVAAPTAGSSGVIPGVITALGEHKNLSEEVKINGLMTSGAIGYIFMRNATVAGAEGGCQAEVGAASAMASAMIVEMLGGSAEQALNASAFAISNILGMVCDPIAGLVESPCQNRNAIGVANAFTSAQLAMAKISHPVPFDEMVDVMYDVGKTLPASLRETAKGGCACTPTGCSLSCKIFNN